MNKEIIYTDSLGLEWSREDLELIGGKELLEEKYKISRKKSEKFLKLSTEKSQTTSQPDLK